MSRTSSALLLLTGLAAGTALGILIAPASGNHTRRRLIRKGEDLRDNFSEMLAAMRENLSDRMGRSGHAAAQQDGVGRHAPAADAK